MMESMYVTTPEPNTHYAIVNKDDKVVGYQYGEYNWYEMGRSEWLINAGYKLTEIPNTQAMSILKEL